MFIIGNCLNRVEKIGKILDELKYVFLHLNTIRWYLGVLPTYVKQYQPVEMIVSTLSLIRSWLGNTADIARMSMKIFKGIKINKMVVQR